MRAGNGRRRSLGGFVAAAAIVAGGFPAGSGTARAAEVVQHTESIRSEALYLRKPPPGAFDIQDDATNADLWLESRASWRWLEGAARLRVHRSSGIAGDAGDESLDRRHLTLRLPDASVTAGNFYETFGNGLVLRTLEQRFVTLNRVDRAFNLDRNLDGVRVRAERGPVRLTALRGTLKSLETYGTGGSQPFPPDDRLWGGEGVLAAGGLAELGLAYVEHSTAVGGGREREDLVSVRGSWNWNGLGGTVEVAGKRHLPDTPRGTARYARLEGSWGRFGVSLEGKSYRNFVFDADELPSLVRTQESVLLNRATHVLLPDDERGLQAEVLYAPDLFTTFTLNLAGSEGAASPRIFRETYLEARTEREGLGAGRLGMDWARDLTKFPAVRNRWTSALELEKFVGERGSVIADLELQAVESGIGDLTNQLLQLGYSRAGRWTLTVTGEHTTDPSASKRDWLFANLDLRLTQNHDLTLGYGSRPAGIVCSGGFCFQSPAFDGAELRWLGRF